MKRNRILGGIGMVWGGFVILQWFIGSSSEQPVSGAYASGLTAGFLFAILMFLVGTYYFFKKPSKT